MKNIFWIEIENRKLLSYMFNDSSMNYQHEIDIKIIFIESFCNNSLNRCASKYHIYAAYAILLIHSILFFLFLLIFVLHFFSIHIYIFIYLLIYLFILCNVLIYVYVCIYVYIHTHTYIYNNRIIFLRINIHIYSEKC